MKYTGTNGEFFEVVDVNSQNCEILKAAGKSELTLIWFTSPENTLIIDAQKRVFNTNDIICLTEFHQVEIIQVNQLKLVRFNRPFYCILDHDSEVSCKGILYYGASTLPIIQLSPEHLTILETFWEMLRIEMESKDNLQLEMLQMMLKRMLILCTRIYKDQNNLQGIEVAGVDLIREFNFLVEKHFKEKHTVADYAALLNKAPKTLANLFKKADQKTPLQFIQERIMLEARRNLNYSAKSISEIGYELGFNDVQTFSRFFKKQEGHSPSEFKNRARKSH